jgi:hypothetical protein
MINYYEIINLTHKTKVCVMSKKLENIQRVSILAAGVAIAGCNATMPTQAPADNKPVGTVSVPPQPTASTNANQGQQNQNGNQSANNNGVATASATVSSRAAYLQWNDASCAAVFTKQSGVKETLRVAANNPVVNKTRNADENCIRIDIASAKKRSEITSYVAKISAPNCGLLASSAAGSVTSGASNLADRASTLAGGLVSSIPAAGAAASASRQAGNAAGSVTASAQARVSEAQRACNADISVISTQLRGVFTEWNKANPKEKAIVNVLTNFNVDQYAELVKTIDGMTGKTATPAAPAPKR